MNFSELAERLSRIQNVLEALIHERRCQKLAARGSNFLPSQHCLALKAALDVAGLCNFGSRISRHELLAARPLVEEELDEPDHDISDAELINAMAEMEAIGWVLKTPRSGWVAIMPDEAAVQPAPVVAQEAEHA